MLWIRPTLFGIGAVLLMCGCRAAPPAGRPCALAAPTAQQPVPTVVHLPAATVAVTRASYQEPAVQRTPESVPVDELLENEDQLSLPVLVATVQARNPSLQAAVAACRAAAERFPQAIALEDPMFMGTLAPASFGSRDVESAYTLQGSQKIPWFGKRQARGRAAQAEADAVCEEVQDARLRLVELTRGAFYDYFLSRRNLELNADNRRIMRQFRDTAQSKYETNQVGQQDVLQADVELIELERRQIELERMDRIATTRINTLLLRNPADPLPPPPLELATVADVPNAEVLRPWAIARRPDLAALAARIEAEQAAVDVARKQYYPDVDVFGRYDTFWQPASTQSDLRPQVGVNLNVPLYQNRRHAAVREAMFRVSQRQAEYEQRVADIEYEVQAASEMLEESRRALRLYSEKLIPAAEQNIAAARANYEAGRLTFLNLAQAQRQFIELRQRQQESLATYHRRLAELERVVGGSLWESPSTQSD